MKLFPSELPASRGERWSLLRAVLDRWFPSSASPTGLADAELVAAEQRLGLKLPPALWEWYASFGSGDAVWCVQDRLRRPDELEVSNGFLLFAVENQTCWYWGIPLGELQSPDPPVFLSNSSAKAWERESDSVSRFALQYAMLNVKFGDGTRFTANGPLTSTQRSKIALEYALLPFGELHTPVFPTRFHGSDEIVVELEGDAWVWATARDQESLIHLDALLTPLGMDWSEFCCD